MFSSLSDNRPSTASSSRSARQGYVNPTFQSSVFNHLNDNLSSSAVNYASASASELNLPARKKVERIEGYSYVMPSAHNYAPKASDINNPDAYEHTEKVSTTIANKKLEQEYERLREEKAKRNEESRAVQQKLHEKHETRLDHKKPNHQTKEEYRQAESQYLSEAMEERNRVQNEKSKLANDLLTQSQKKSDKLQAELEKDKRDTRTGFHMKPRKEYNIDEYKDTLKNQINEKTLKASHEKNVKQNEREARLQELRDQERMVEHYNDQLRNRPQSGLEPGRTSLTVNSSTLGKKTDWEEASNEMIRKKDEQDFHKRTLQGQISAKNNKKEYEVIKRKEEEKAVKGINPNNHRAFVTAEEVAGVLKNQMQKKQQTKDREAEVKQSEVLTRKEEIKASEKVAWQQYGETRQKKAEMFEQYQKDQDSYAPIKKNKGLMTVKIN